ncbi:MAG: hypothetical protein PHO02_06580, partial [Candidatus Nanoarchaeia archaeon]|nr:hypothetical protein [Candidatus Nanoarchaeia archaeon]
MGQEQNKTIYGLYTTYEAIFKTSVAMNEQNILPSFHNVLSPFVHNKFYFGRNNIDAKIHNFMLQDSGSGKGVIQNQSQNLLEQCEKKSRIVQSFTTAGIIGSLRINQTTGNTEMNKPLEEHDWLGIDEGSIFMGNPNQHVMDFIKTINGYLDSGKVCKMLACGKLDYTGKATLSFGSFIDKSVKITILHTGFFQRFWVSHTQYTEEECAEMRRKMDELAIKQKVEESDEPGLINQLMNSIREINSFAGRVYSFTPEQAHYYSKKFEGIVDTKDTQNLNEPMKTIFRTSLTRAKKLGYKVMVHYATVNREEELSKEAIDYALKAVEMHLGSFLSLLVSLNPTAGSVVVGINKMNLMKKECRQKILQALAEKGVFTRSEFHAKLKQEYGISLGEQSCDKIFQELIAEKKISFKTGEKNSISYHEDACAGLAAGLALFGSRSLWLSY